MTMTMDRVANRQHLAQPGSNDNIKELFARCMVLRERLKTANHPELAQMEQEWKILTQLHPIRAKLLMEYWESAALELLDVPRHVYTYDASCKERESLYQPMSAPKEPQ